MKRSSERQITKNDGTGASDDDADAAENNGGTFKRAPPEVLATRKILKVKRRATPTAGLPDNATSPAAAAAGAPASNPFAGVTLAASGPAAEPKPSADAAGAEAGAETTPSATAPNGQAAADTPAVATDDKANEPTNGKLTEAEATGQNGAEPAAPLAAAADETKNDTAKPSEKPAEDAPPAAAAVTDATKSVPVPSFTFGAPPASADGTVKFDFSSLAAKPATSFNFNMPSSSIVKPAAGDDGQPDDFTGGEDGPAPTAGIQKAANPILPEKEVVTGEENEKEVFRSKSKVYRLEEDAWKERGTGLLKINTGSEGKTARVVMRAEGAQRVVLNFALWGKFKADKASEKSARFSVPDADGKPTSYLARFATADDLGAFVAAVEKSVPNLAGD